MLVCLNSINKGLYKLFNDKIFLINSSVRNNSLMFYSNWLSCHVIISDDYVIIHMDKIAIVAYMPLGMFFIS